MVAIRGPAPVAALVAVAGALTVAAAWTFEILGGYVPCPLCLQQRYPYYAAVPLAAAIALWAPRMGAGWPARLGLAAVAAIFAAGAVLGVYHAGAEWGWWQGPADCAAVGGAVTGDAAGLLDQVRAARVVRCDEAPWRFAGMSFAGWNAVISAVLATLSMAGAAIRPRAYGSSSASQ